jgi:DNA-binding MarR family transcriptional regulator
VVGLTDDENQIWREFLHWSESVRADVAASLTAATGLSVGDFEIMVRLAEAGGSLDQRDLHMSLGWSASRLSHQLRRMESRDLIARAEVGSGRLMRVELTTEGAGRIVEALDVHAVAVRARLLDSLNQADRRLIARMARRAD